MKQLTPVDISRYLTYYQVSDNKKVAVYRGNYLVPTHVVGTECIEFTASNEDDIATDSSQTLDLNPAPVHHNAYYVLGRLVNASVVRTVLDATHSLSDEKVLALDFTQIQQQQLYAALTTPSTPDPYWIKKLVQKRDAHIVETYETELELNKDKPEQTRHNWAVHETSKWVFLSPFHVEKVLKSRGLLRKLTSQLPNPLLGAEPGLHKELNAIKLNTRNYYSKYGEVNIDVSKLVTYIPTPGAVGVNRKIAVIPPACPITKKQFTLPHVHRMSDRLTDMVIGRKSIELAPGGDNLILVSREARAVRELDRLYHKPPRWIGMTPDEWTTHTQQIAAQWEEYFNSEQPQDHEY